MKHDKITIMGVLRLYNDKTIIVVVVIVVSLVLLVVFRKAAVTFLFWLFFLLVKLLCIAFVLLLSYGCGWLLHNYFFSGLLNASPELSLTLSVIFTVAIVFGAIVPVVRKIKIPIIEIGTNRGTRYWFRK